MKRCKSINMLIASLTVIGLFSLAKAGGNTLNLEKIGTIRTGGFGTGAAEISAFDSKTKRLFVTNAEFNTIDIVSVDNPYSPYKTGSINCSDFGGNVNSIAVKCGIVAAAIEANNKQENGCVAFFATDGSFIKQVTVGALPDMLTFTPDGKKVLVANEGEPDPSYTVDPEGTVSIIDLSRGIKHATVRTVSFNHFNPHKNHLIQQGVRIYGPGATVAQDLEPEYIAIDNTGRWAAVTLQENNAIAQIDIQKGVCVRIIPLGTKDYSLDINKLDPSDKDKTVAINNWPLLGLYQPDAIGIYTSRGMPYMVIANEGDSRDYEGFSEEVRIKDLKLDTTVFTNTESLLNDKQIGRLKTTIALADTNESGEYRKLYTYGGRSFSILSHTGRMIYDSRDDFEQKTAFLDSVHFNSDNASNSSFDSRSDDKGPEPEALAIGQVHGRYYAFIGLERVGGIMVYDITNPCDVQFVTFTNNRDFSLDAESQDCGDLGVEGLLFIDAVESPTKKPLLVASNEISGTVTIYQIDVKSQCTRF